MESKNYKNIVNNIQKTISDGLGDSLIKKLEFEYTIANKDELTNYILILLVLVEDPYYHDNSSNLLLRKVLANISKFRFIKNGDEVFEIIKANAVSPYSGIASFNGRIIKAIIYNKPDEMQLISNWTNKEFLLDFNIEILKKRIEESPTQTNDILKILYNCIYNINSEYVVELDKKALTTFKDYLIDNSKSFETYLHHFIRFKWYGGSRNDYMGKEIVPEPFYNKIFGSTENFIELLNQKIASESDNRIYTDVSKFISVYDEKKYAVYDSEKIHLDYSLHYNIYKELQI